MLTINYNSTDLSVKLADFSAPGKAITLDVGEYIYIGYKKPINNIHVEFTTVVTSLSNIKLEAEAGSGFEDVLELIDYTNGLGNSGKINWTNIDQQVKATRFGKELYWYRLSVNVATEPRTYLGVGAIFSSDKDLAEVFPGITNHLPEDSLSFINFHVDARKDIVQELRKKYTANSNLLTEFDLLINEEVRQSAKYLALSKICGWLSDAPGDKWELREIKYLAQATNFLSTITLTIDTNDNGETDEEEKNSIQFVRVNRA